MKLRGLSVDHISSLNYYVELTLNCTFAVPPLPHLTDKLRGYFKFVVVVTILQGNSVSAVSQIFYLLSRMQNIPMLFLWCFGVMIIRSAQLVRILHFLSAKTTKTKWPQVDWSDSALYHLFPILYSLLHLYTSNFEFGQMSQVILIYNMN